MKIIFVDSNVFLRFFARDDNAQHEKSVALFQKALDGKVYLVTGPPVLFEIAWTLRSAYRKPPEVILEVLEAICGIPGLTLIDEEIVFDSVALARHCGQEFADAYICVSARGSYAEEIATFNRHDFERLGAQVMNWA